MLPEQSNHPGKVELTKDRPVFTPATDIRERSDALLVICDMPGVDARHIDITVEDNVLSLTGYQEIQDPEGYDLLHRGYTPGVYERSFRLGTDIDEERIKARMTNGVLEITLSKSEQAQPKKITVDV